MRINSSQKPLKSSKNSKKSSTEQWARKNHNNTAISSTRK
jgi:hypothetical protein